MTTTSHTSASNDHLINQIRAAIARSQSHDEIAHITIPGDSGDALSAICELWDGDSDYSLSDYEGKDRLDVWGWTDSTPQDGMEWRLSITFAAAQQD